MKKFRTALRLSLILPLLFSTSARALDRQSAVVHEVLSGDTVRLQGGKILKFTAIQAPALQSLIPLVRQYGADALAFNKKLTEGKKIIVEWGPQIRDARNNLLGYVFLEDGTFVNEAILKAGHARVHMTPPNIRYAANFRKAELAARRDKLGLWKDEPENPFIKSEYIGEKNTKVYYFPTSPELERIPQANLVTFRSRVEAKAAGYRPCPTCHEDSIDDRFGAEY